MPSPVSIALFSDVHCPYAYLTAFRLRALRDEFAGRITIVYKSLALEYVNQRSTPKPVLDNETPILLLEEPNIPYHPWSRPDAEWPVTMWPAFEAIKCAEQQSPQLAADLDWAIRVAFFGESRCISMRHVLFELAEHAGLNMQQFGADFDNGVCKRLVLHEAQEGWEQRKVEGSPTFVLESGKQASYLALPKVKLDQKQHYRVVHATPAPCHGAACLDALRALFEEALGEEA